MINIGRFKFEDAHNPITQWLMQQGFEETTGARGEEGLTKVYKTSNGLYYVWVTINLNKRKIYVYEEYNCGGMTGEDEITIEREWLSNLDIFINEVDEALGRWIDN